MEQHVFEGGEGKIIVIAGMYKKMPTLLLMRSAEKNPIGVLAPPFLITEQHVKDAEVVLTWSNHESLEAFALAFAWVFERAAHELGEEW